MQNINIVKDILTYRSTSQKYYNEQLIIIRNPEVRQMYIQLRDDEMRAVTKLQQKEKRLDAQTTVIQKIFTIKSTY